MTVSRIPDLVRAIRATYTALAEAGDTVPTLQYGSRYEGQDHGANHILLVTVVEGAAGQTPRLPAGYVASRPQALDAHVWSAEPEIADPAGADEIEMELARDDVNDAMVDRYINVLKLLTPGYGEGATITVNPPGSVLTHGEKAIVRFKYVRGVERDEAVWRVPIAARATRDPMRPEGDTGKTFKIDPTVERGS